LNRSCGDPYDPELPPELAAALIEFDTWSKAQLLVEQNESTPTEPLYHYTGYESLRGILSRERVWCLSHLHQSDPTEFSYSLEIARRIITELGNSIRTAIEDSGCDGRNSDRAACACRRGDEGEGTSLWSRLSE